MRQKGQNLGEYGIAFGLIVVVSIAVLSLIGTNVSDLFTGSIKKKSPAQTARATSNSSAPATSLASGNLPFSNLPGKLVQVDLGNGKSLQLNYADPVAVAEAAGGNGVTENALAVLDQVIAQLKEQGEDEAQIAELEKLAMAGHKIKDLQKLVEAKYPAAGFRNNRERFQFLSDPANSVVVDGKEVTLLKTLKLLNGAGMALSGDKGDFFAHYAYYDAYIKGSDLDPRNDDRNTLPENAFYTDKTFNNYTHSIFNNDYMPLNEFMYQLDTVKQLGILSNPVLKRLIADDLSRQIFISSSQMAQVPTRSEVGKLVQITRTSSNDICTASNAVTCQDRAG